MQTLLPQLLTVETFNPTSSIVGNGIPGQVSAAFLNSYSWRIVSKDLPGFVKTGEFPNSQNPNSIIAQAINFLWPYRGGLNLPAQNFMQRPPRGPIGISAVGIVFFGPEADIKIAGGRGTVWNLNAVVANLFGEDEYGGCPTSTGAYRYQDSEFITNNAWSDISGFNTGYRQIDGHSKIVGWAVDGYPIYGPYGYLNPTNGTSQIVRMTSSYQLETKANRPSNPTIITRGVVTKSNIINLTTTANIAPGLVITGGTLPGPCKVLQVSGNSIVIDQRVNLATNVRLQGSWPAGIFVEDYSYVSGLGSLDRHNGRFCVTPEYPNGTYAYFVTEDDNGPVFPYIIGETVYGNIAITPPPEAPPLVWVTPAGSLGTLVIDKFFEIPVRATAADTVYYEVIAGNLPDGVALDATGIIAGVPVLGGVPTLSTLGLIGIDITSKFVIRAYTKTVVNGVLVVNEFLDQTFTLTVPGQALPQFATPSGNIGTFYDGSPIAPIQLTFSGPLYNSVVRLAAGNLPPGLTVSTNGLISGYIQPLPIGSQLAGYDLTPEDVYGYDFLAQSESLNYQFSLEITDGVSANLRTFEIYVYSRNNLTADDTIITADTTEVTADETPNRPPFMITPEGDIGTYQDDNFFAFKFNAVDLDQQTIQYNLIVESTPEHNWSIPQGLSLDPLTGWLYGYLPQQGLSSITYTIAIRISDVNDPTVVSPIYLYTMTVTAGIDTRVIWISPADLGSIDNGSESLFTIRAITPQPRDLAYRLKPGSNSLLPKGLRLLPSGNIAGTVSYDTFTLDTGTTTFDVTNRNLLSSTPTTFDLTYTFVVEVYSPTTQQVSYKVTGITVQDGGQGYAQDAIVTIAPPPGQGVAATVDTVTTQFVPGQGYQIVSVTIKDQGFGYQAAPIVTVTDPDDGSSMPGTGAVLTANIAPVQSDFLVSEYRTFTIHINRKYQTPLDTLYIKGLLSDADREILANLLQDPSLISYQNVFRPDDANFGVSRGLKYAHAFGLNPATAADYQRALELNHYWKQLALGPVQTARALDSDGTPIYEVIYCPVIDNLINEQGQSVGKEVTLDVPISGYLDDSTVITTVYPNALVDMRDQVIDVIGQVGTILPLWMTSLQENGRQLGYIPAWVVAYVTPGNATRIAYYINQQFENLFNRIDFDVDRYELGRQLSINWDPVTGTWVPPASSTTFDENTHYRVPETNDSSIVFNGGTGYAVGNKIRILGSDLGGIDVYNDLVITVLDVGTVGNITYYALVGQAFPLKQGEIFYNVVGTNISGTGAGATWDIIIASGDPTIFDGGSMEFNVPADIYGVTDQYDKYLVFPKRNILN
jgi:hypothetical protein